MEKEKQEIESVKKNGKKNENTMLDSQIRIRVTKQEKVELKKRCQILGITMSEYILSHIKKTLHP